MKKFKTVLVGFGNIAEGISDDKKMARFYKYQSHAQVLKAHPEFEWCAVIESDEEKRNIAKLKWGVPVVCESINQLPQSIKPEVFVIVTNPEHRNELLEEIKYSKGIIVEKPLGNTCDKSEIFVKKCKEFGLITQVNLFRRADKTNEYIKNEIIPKKIGDVQFINCIYGNGLLNNGLHMIDLIRYFYGEFVSLSGVNINNDSLSYQGKNLFVNLELENGGIVNMVPIDFKNYRDVSIDIWGNKGRLEIYRESLNIRHYSIRQHVAAENTLELDVEHPETIDSYCGDAYFNIYNDFALALNGRKSVCSSAENALKNESIIEKAYFSAKNNGARIKL